MTSDDDISRLIADLEEMSVLQEKIAEELIKKGTSPQSCLTIFTDMLVWGLALLNTKEEEDALLKELQEEVVISRMMLKNKVIPLACAKTIELFNPKRGEWYDDN